MNRFIIRDGIVIDLTRVMNASVLVAGRTRSGKTTGILSTMVLPVLLCGRDQFDSEVIIVDPKNAELSTCPHVLSPDLNGSVKHIIDAIQGFNSNRIKRQQFINEACRNSGHPVKWWDIGMQPSLLFLDEFIALQGLLPKKAPKDAPSYCLTEFQNLIRQIATQGASAGCFLILSTAEASVGTGGLESAVNKACGIRILFKPSKEEASYLWNSTALEPLRERHYQAGDAWFSADDGINDKVRFVRFPFVRFGEYQALSRLLAEYYGD